MCVIMGGEILLSAFFIPASAADSEVSYTNAFNDLKLNNSFNPDNYPQGRNADTWPFNKPFELKLNLAWGGDWGGMHGVDESCLPATYEIDYVRVFQQQ